MTSDAGESSTTNLERDRDNCFTTEKSFPTKLYKFLNEVERYNIAHIASWQPHGQAFRIHDPSKFVNLVEPRWFVHKKYTSFQRQLCIYGFKRIANGLDKNGYWHSNFIRGREDLLEQLHRIPIKKNNHYVPLAAMPSEPDFYSSMTLHDNGRTTRLTSEPESSPYPVENANSNTTRTLQLGYNSFDTNYQLEDARMHANHPILQTFRNEAVDVDRRSTLANVGENHAAAGMSNSILAALLQRANSHPSVNLSTGIASNNTVNHYQQMNNSLSLIAPLPGIQDLVASLLQLEGAGPTIVPPLVLQQRLASLLGMNSMSQQSHEMLTASQAAGRPADQTYLNPSFTLPATLPLRQTEQSTPQQQLQSIINSIIELTLLQGNELSLQTILDSLRAYLLSSSGATALSRRDDLAPQNYVQHQILLDDVNRSLHPPGITNLGNPQTTTSVDDGGIAGIDHILRSDTVRNDTQRNVTLNSTFTRQLHQNEPASPSALDESLMIANVLERYRSSSS